MMIYIKFLVLYVLIDMIWIIGGNKFHTDMINKVQGSNITPNYIAALLYYLMAPLAYVYIIKPLSKTKEDVIKNSILVGLLMYGTFDLTNKALFKNYPWTYTIADMTWGMFSITATSYIIYNSS